MAVHLNDSILRQLLRNVYFINGTAYAGKSTMVRMLAEKHGGVHCGENYHDVLMADGLDPAEFPNLCYFQTMSGWDEFLRRDPETYAAWIEGGALEAAQLEIIHLLRITGQTDRPVFVDTNIPLEWLQRIAAPEHVAIMLAPQRTSVERFFDRSDPEKQFLLRKLEAMPDAEAAIANFRACLERINSQEVYDRFLHSGLFTLIRDDSRTPEETLTILEEHFLLNNND